MFPTYFCEFIDLVPLDGGFAMRAVVTTPSRSFPSGSEIRTSKLKSIDFERGIAVTQNSVYCFRGTP